MAIVEGVENSPLCRQTLPWHIFYCVLGGEGEGEIPRGTNKSRKEHPIQSLCIVSSG